MNFQKIKNWWNSPATKTDIVYGAVAFVVAFALIQFAMPRF